MSGEWRDVCRALDRFAEQLLLGNEEPERVYAFMVGIIESFDPELQAAVQRVLEAHATARARRARTIAAYDRVNGPT